jgi:hypothetical protein
MNLLTISPSTFYKDSLFFLAVVEIGFSMLATIETSSCAARKKKKKNPHKISQIAMIGSTSF